MEDPKQQTLREFLFCAASESLMTELSDENKYWESVCEFVDENGDKKMAALSSKAVAWAIKIKNDLMEEA